MRVRSYAPDDVIGIERLFIDRGLQFDRELFLWKKKAPSVFTWVGVQDDLLVAHYSIIEMPMFPGIRTGFAVDAIFAKQSSQIPNIAKLLNHALKEVQHSGIGIVIGVPNKRMGPVKRLLGWSPAPLYSWGLSKGTELISNTVLFDDDSVSAYEQWRWVEVPRRYNGYKESNIVLSGNFKHDGAPYLLRYLTSNWQEIEGTYAFSYLRKQLGNQPPDVEPLFTLLDKDVIETSIEWPEVWPMETLEGVVLGW